MGLAGKIERQAALRLATMIIGLTLVLAYPENVSVISNSVVDGEDGYKDGVNDLQMIPTPFVGPFCNAFSMHRG